MTHNAAHAMHERSLELQVATCPRSEFQIFLILAQEKPNFKTAARKPTPCQRPPVPPAPLRGRVQSSFVAEKQTAAMLAPLRSILCWINPSPVAPLTLLVKSPASQRSLTPPTNSVGEEPCQPKEFDFPARRSGNETVFIYFNVELLYCYVSYKK